MNHIIDCERFALAAVQGSNIGGDSQNAAKHALAVYEEAYEACLRRNEPLELENQREAEEEAEKKFKGSRKI